MMPEGNVEERVNWADVVLEAMKLLGAESKAVSIQEIYEMVKKVAPSKCVDSNVYMHMRGNVSRIEPRWKKNVRSALYSLKRKGLVSREGPRLWRLTETSTSSAP
jgi:hypothetical protein